jgi:hypothetical protein
LAGHYKLVLPRPRARVKTVWHRHSAQPAF